jgi:hypothetical protein
MNKKILHTEVQQWLIDNLNTELTKLILKGSPFEGITVNELAEQIESRKKSEKKLPNWFNTGNIYYPKKLSIEQTSSQKTALYKANLVSGDTLIDLTAGLGVDDFYFAKHFRQVISCEINEELAQIASHNFKELNIKNIIYKSIDGVNLLKKEIKTYDWIYLDPARRNDSKGKVFLLEDCLPNVPAIIDLLFSRTNKILIKTSPMLDIKQGIRELKHVKEIHVIAVNNEVKELLWILTNNFLFDGIKVDNLPSEIKIITTNIKNLQNEKFSFLEPEEANSSVNYSEPKKYIYDPNNAIRKAGGFKLISSRFSLSKINQNSHLYTSDKLIEFPGRRFLVLENIPYNTKKTKTLFKNKKANVITRNFPINAQTLQKELRIKDGGETYLFFTTDLNNNKIVLVCQRINTDKQ